MLWILKVTKDSTNIYNVMYFGPEKYAKVTFTKYSVVKSKCSLDKNRKKKVNKNTIKPTDI